MNSFFKHLFGLDRKPPEPLPPVEDPEDILSAYLKSCIELLDREREEFIASPTKRMEVVTIFYKDWGFVPVDVRSLLDEFAQIQMTREWNNDRALKREIAMRGIRDRIGRKYDQRLAEILKEQSGLGSVSEGLPGSGPDAAEDDGTGSGSKGD